jgi:hypothetical protein
MEGAPTTFSSQITNQLLVESHKLALI